MNKILRQLIFSILIVRCLTGSIYFSDVKTCECISFVLCDNGSEITDGAGLLDVRLNLQNLRKSRSAPQCENILEVCCEPSNVIKSHQLKQEPNELVRGDQGGCGFQSVVPRIMNRNENEAKFGEYPWMVALLHSSINALDVYQCGGSLIHPNVILTAAHCLHSVNASVLKIRAGEWDTQTTTEVLPHQDRAVEKIVIHENYDPRSLRNDYALLFLASPVKITENVNNICLPASLYEFDTTRCTVSGWGKNQFGKNGQYGEVLKKASFSIIPRRTCQNSLRTTRLGKKFKLHKSFVCAGGEEGEDTCKGDGGSPLVCPLKLNPERFVQVGIVSWGIGCGSSLPGVYGSVIYALPWINEQLAINKLDNSVYKHNMTQENLLYPTNNKKNIKTD